MQKHLNLKIYGRVIGVGFRWSAWEQAKKFGIKGFVRNVEEGHLYIEAEGKEDQLEKFLAWCRKGPFWAKVERVEVSDGEIRGFKSFDVVR